VVGPSDLIYGVLLPALIAGVLLLLGGRGTSHAGRPRPLLGALAIGIGYLVAHTMRIGVPPVPFGTTQVPARDWIAWIVVGAIVLAPIRAIPRLERWSGPLYLALFSVLIFKLVLGNAVASDMGGLLVRLALTVALYTGWNLLERLSLRSTGPALPVGLIVAGSGIAASLLFSNAELPAQMCGAVCAGLGAAAVVGTMDKGFRLPIGALAVAVIVFAGNLVLGSVYDLPRASAALLALALLAPWASEWGKLASMTPTRRALVSAVAAAIPAAIAVAVAHAANTAPEPPGK
jgi:hypothetical protein